YSLKAFWHIFRSWRRVIAKRRWIMARKRVSDEYMAAWFHHEPVSRPAPKKAVAALSPARSQAQIAEGGAGAMDGPRSRPLPPAGGALAGTAAWRRPGERRPGATPAAAPR
ncbi:MAG: hypothetical protein N2036_09095, partial [Bryobacteraceae bacterium]|nr:hypothetical protein [Bryobacteraceae bacterium]